MRVLVTGAAGYIGSHFIRMLKAAGIDSVALDNLSRGYKERLLCEVPFELVDLAKADSTGISEVLKKRCIDAVVHFAGYAHVGESIVRPDLYFINNSKATINLLEACRMASVRRFVFSSSCATYGEPDLPITEDTDQRPINPYGISKLQCEQALHAYCEAFGMTGIAFRYFNAAGSDEGFATLEYRKTGEPLPRLIPRAYQAWARSQPPLQVNGTDYDTEDGTCVRDYVHVEDLCSAHLKSLNAGIEGFRAFNLSTGKGSSVLDVVKAVEKATGKSLPVVYAKRRPGDPASLYADSSRAFDELGWRATRDLERIALDAMPDLEVARAC